MEQNGPNAKAELLAAAPARIVLRLFGEAGCMAIAGVGSEALKKWKRRRESGGGGGLVPQQYQARFLAEAERRGLPLTAADLIAEPY